MSDIPNNNYLNEIKHVCNTELMQFTLGKTEKTINNIKLETQQWLEYLEINDDTVPGTMVIPIVLTNNSLAETEQWTIRLGKELKDLNIVIVSSKDTADYSNANDIITYMKECELKEIPNVIVMCTNGVRIKTCLKMFKAFSHLSPSPRTDIKILFDTYFDEIDKQTGLLKTFLKDLNKNRYICPGTDIPLINKILYISATPDQGFWKSLISFGIPELENLDRILENKYPRPSHDDLVSGYKNIKNDCIIYHESDSEPVIYVDEILNSDSFDLNQRNIIFAPAKNTVESHDRMKNLFNSLGFTVLLHNGKFKGFVDPNGDATSLDTFNLKHFTTDNPPQMMDTLRKWNELNPNKSLAITGYNTIERGVTFNTNGFNFTHTIISPYHSKKMNKLLQLIGRDHGNTNYCKPCIFITTKNIFDKCEDYIDRFLKMKEAIIETYNISDFSKSPSTIPVKIIFNDSNLLDEFINIAKSWPNKKGKLNKDDEKKRIKAYNDIENILLKYKDTEKITWLDLNNRNKIILSERKLKTIRRYIGGEDKSRRFKMFSKNHDNRKVNSQKSEIDEYTLDMACVEYIDGEYINPTNIIWLTYRNE